MILLPTNDNLFYGSNKSEAIGGISAITYYWIRISKIYYTDYVLNNTKTFDACWKKHSKPRSFTSSVWPTIYSQRKIAVHIIIYKLAVPILRDPFRPYLNIPVYSTKGTHYHFCPVFWIIHCVSNIYLILKLFQKINFFLSFGKFDIFLKFEWWLINDSI